MTLDLLGLVRLFPRPSDARPKANLRPHTHFLTSHRRRAHRSPCAGPISYLGTPRTRRTLARASLSDVTSRRSSSRQVDTASRPHHPTPHHATPHHATTRRTAAGEGGLPTPTSTHTPPHPHTVRPYDPSPPKPTHNPHSLAAGVDLVLSGHVHAYERTHPVANGAADDGGAVHITIGCGGNREGAAFDYRQPKPDWSAFRESSFGIGTLRIVNETHARLHWHRTACESSDAPEHESFDASCRSMEPLPAGAPSPQQEGKPIGQSTTRLVHEDGSGFSWVKSESAWIVRWVGRSVPGASQWQARGFSGLPSATAGVERTSAVPNLEESGQIVEERGGGVRPEGSYGPQARVRGTDGAGGAGGSGGWSDRLAAHGPALVLCLLLGGFAGLATLSGMRLWKRVVEGAGRTRDLEAKAELLEGTATCAQHGSLTTRYVCRSG